MFGFPHPLATNMAHVVGPAASTQVGDPVGDGVLGAGVLGAEFNKKRKCLGLYQTVQP